MIVVIDHFDSFVETLARYVREAGQETLVMRQTVSVEDVLAVAPTSVILSPGPGGPDTTGVTQDLLAALPDSVPVLGICLGHQTLAAHLGASIGKAQEPRHGKPSELTHSGHWLFEGIESPFQAGRYHALIVEQLPEDCQLIASSARGEIMGLAHKTRPLYGLQFHPESILTPQGRTILERFLKHLPSQKADAA